MELNYAKEKIIIYCVNLCLDNNIFDGENSIFLDSATNAIFAIHNQQEKISQNDMSVIYNCLITVIKAYKGEFDNFKLTPIQFKKIQKDKKTILKLISDLETMFGFTHPK